MTKVHEVFMDTDRPSESRSQALARFKGLAKAIPVLLSAVQRPITLAIEVKEVWFNYKTIVDQVPILKSCSINVERGTM